MTEKTKNINNLKLRARMPLIVRGLAIFALIATVLGIGIGFYLARNNTEFRMKSFPTELSKEVVAVVQGYERRETEDGKLKYYITADKATTFTDNHQELENVFLQVFDDAGENSDRISAQKAVYIPVEDGSKNFTAFFAGNVNIETRDALKVKTEQLTYTKETEIAEAEELVEFERENVSGRSFGAIVRVKEKQLELLKQVEISAFAVEANEEFAKTDLKSAYLAAGRALVDQSAEKIELEHGVNISLTPKGELAQPADIKANRATAFFTHKEIKQIDLNGNVEVHQKPTNAVAKWTKTKANRVVAKINKELKRLELFENVDIETTANDSKPTRIKTQYALYEKDIDRFELKNGVEIITAQENQPTNIRASEAIYEQSNGKVFLFGNAEVTQGPDYIKGDKLNADLFPNKRIKYAVALGSAYLKQETNDRTTEVTAPELNAAFNENQQLQNANALGSSNVVLVPSNSPEYTRIALSAPNAIRLNFQTNGLLQQMQTEGRTTIQLNAPNNRADAANKRLTADAIKTILQANGKDLARAEAVGNAELFVEPLRALPENYKTTVNAPRFDCDFYETGNNAKNCAAGVKAKAVRIPTVAGENRGTQTLSADKMNAIFNQQTQDVQQFDAAGNAKFSELDRNGIANQIIYTASDGFVRLRGGDPTLWDSQARAKSGEIDWDTRNQKSALRGGVSTTYYSQKQTGGATPFENVNSPVFLTAETAEFDHRAQTAVYSGNARAWQENNYVRGDRLIIQQNQGQLVAEGSVQSLLYDAKRRENGRETTVPVYASANRMSYNRQNRLLRYEGNVDIRQGTDRITAGIANVLLDAKNEMAQTTIEQNVIVTQPGRRASGDWAQYTAANETVVLRGSPANVEDAEQGSSQGAQLTVNLREKTVVGEGKTKESNTGRIRSVYKVKKNE